MSKKFNEQAKLASLNDPKWDSSSDDEPQISKRKNKKGFDSKANIVNLDEGAEASESKGNAGGKNKKGKGAGGKKEKGEGSSVIYLGHLPSGFEEEELGGFLSQFGDVVGIHVSRSKRTGNPKGYAFVKFRDNETAGIVSESMSGYFLMERRLVSHVVDEKDVRNDMFSGKFRKIDWVGLHREKVNKERTKEEEEEKVKGKMSKLDKKMAKLKAMGMVDYGVDELMGGVGGWVEGWGEKEVKKSAKEGTKKRASKEGVGASGKKKRAS